MKQFPGSGSLILEKAAAMVADRLQRYRIPFFSALFFGLLAYGYAFTNKLVNHDEVSSLFAKGATVSSGRWGLGALDSIFPNYSMPWIYGILTVFLMALAVCVIIHIFSLKNPVLQVLLAGCIVVFPSLIGLLGYMFTSTSFALSFLLATVAAAWIRDLRKWYIIPALGCLVLSLSIYQSYISVTASLLVLVLIQQLLQEDLPLQTFRKGICFVVFLVAGLGVYYLGTQCVLRLTGTEFNSYASENLAFSLSSVLEGAAFAYSNFIRFFQDGFRGLIPTGFSRAVHWLMLADLCLLLPLVLRKKAVSLGQLLLLVALLVVLPLSVNCMYMITTPDSIHTLVLYGFVAVYILAAVVTDEMISLAENTWFSGILTNLLTILMVLIIVVNTYVANQSYLQLHLRYENAYAFYTSLFADIKMMPEFDEDTRLAIVGEYRQPEFYEQQFVHLQELTGVTGFLPDNYSKNYFMAYYIGFPVAFASPEEIAQIQNSAEFQEMSVYPYYGSLKKIGELLVVKLS